MRTCSKCGVDKPMSSEFFHKNSSDKTGWHSNCKVCRTEQHRVHGFRYHLFKKYRITLEDFERMRERQKNVCAICLTSLTREQMRVDHCHKTGAVRGILCNSCNVGLGGFKDNIRNIRRSIKYLSRGRKQSAGFGNQRHLEHYQGDRPTKKKT